MCTFTKYAIAAPMPDQTAITVADNLIKKLICTFGAPNAIVSDRGTNFTSKLMKRIAARFKIKHITTTSYHPQANNVERIHHSLTEYLKMFAARTKEWDEHIDLAMFNYNTSWHSSHQFSPWELVFARKPRLPSAEPPLEQDLLPTYEGYIEKLVKQLHTIHEIAREKLLISKEKFKTYYDKKTNHKEFKVGQWVFLKSGPKPHKLTGKHHTGPFLILEVGENNNIKIQINNNETQMVHASQLRLSHIKKNEQNSE